MQIINESSLKQRIEFLKEDLSKENPELPQRLQEKGVEITVLVPIFEILLDFNSFWDIEYEYTNDKRFERFDFLIDKRMLVEAKKLNTPIETLTVNQKIKSYIHYNNNINYGILSNGSEYMVFVKKKFIEEFLHPEEKMQVDLTDNVIHSFTFSIFEPEFFDVIKMFSKNIYHESFCKIARFMLTRINKTKTTKICDDKELNSFIQGKIEKTMSIEHGQFLSNIQNGTMLPGDVLTFAEDFIKIPVHIQNDGRILLKKGEVQISNLAKAMESEFAPSIQFVMNEWKNNDFIFNNTNDVIKVAINKERLRKEYIFK